MFERRSASDRQSRLRHQELATVVTNRKEVPEGTKTFVGVVIDGMTGRMPTDPGHFFLVNPIVGINGSECQGCPGSPVFDPAQQTPVLVLGNAPSVGDMLVCFGVGGRWVAEADCECSTNCAPVTICTATSVCSNGVFFPATGVTVVVTQGGKTIGSGVTSSSTGCFTLTIPESNSNYTLATSGNPRYKDTTISGALLSCGETVDISLDKSDDFVCSCLSNEPVSPTLMVTGGTGSTTISSGGGSSFTLSAGVSVLVPDNFGNCFGGIQSDPCSVGSDLTVPFSPGQGSDCLEIVQSWTRSTDCNQSESSPVLPDAFSLYINQGQSAGIVDQWLSGPPSDASSVCMGYFTQDDLSQGTSGPGPFSVPLNITINFPAGGISSPPIPSLTITEQLPSSPMAREAEPKTEFPSLATQAANALGAIGRVVGAVATGQAVMVSQEVLEKRRDECETCENMIGDRCKLCGCWYQKKIRLATESCPMNPPRWSAYNAD
jgi:hypothetical protein